MLKLMRFSAFFLLFIYFPVFAQDPPEIHWKAIETNHYRLIFAEELSIEANRVANLLEANYISTGGSMGGRHRKLPIVLRNQSAIPNAFVSLAPWKSEWYHVPLPFKEMGSTEWYELLVIHEGRHVFQFGQADRRINRLFRLLGGERIQSLAGFLMIPGWFWEGDAVVNETLLSESGRGRQPYFNREIRALLLDGTRYSYRKALHGSLKNEYPNYYHYGYLMSSHVSRKYGSEALSKIIYQTLKWPIIRNPFNPFSAAAKKVTGRSTSQLFHDAMDEMSNVWKNQIEGIQFTELEVLSPGNLKYRTDYLFPGYDKEGNLYAVKRSLSQVALLVQLNDGVEEKVITELPSIVEKFGIHIADGFAVWNEIQPDRRWTKLSWSNIVLYDLKNGVRKQLTEKARYFSPAISADGSKIAVIEFTETRECFLVILDRVTGKILDRFPSPGNTSILNPRWSENGEKIVFASHQLNGKSISIINLSNGEIKKIKPESWEELFKPIFYNNYIIYESSYSGIDNLYATEISTGATFQITSVKVASSNAVISTNKKDLVFNDYTSKGDRIVSIPIDQDQWVPIESVNIRNDTTTDSLMIKNPSSETKSLTKKYDITDYNHFGSFFNFHSWEVTLEKVEPTFSLFSDNVLGTASFHFRTSYNRNEKKLFSELRGGYRGWYPILSGGFGWGERLNPETLDVPVGRADTAKSHLTHFWQEQRFDIRVTLPVINRLIGVKTEALNITTTLQRTTTSNHEVAFTWPERDDLPDTTLANEAADGTIFPITLETNYAFYTEDAPRDVMPRKGAEVDVAITNTPFKSEFKGSRAFFGTAVFLPGFFSHDAVRVFGALEKKKDEGYPFKSLVEMPLTYEYVFHEEVKSLTAYYRTPLFYPDRGLDMMPLMGWLKFGYVKRVSLDIFGEWMRGSDGKAAQDYLTIGAGFTFEASAFHLPFMFPISILYAYRPTRGVGSVEFRLVF